MEWANEIKFWMNLIGWMGAVCFLLSYWMLISKKWKADTYHYHMANISGALFMVINTSYDASYPSVVINGTWGLIAIYGWYRDSKKLSESNEAQNIS